MTPEVEYTVHFLAIARTQTRNEGVKKGLSFEMIQHCLGSRVVFGYPFDWGVRERQVLVENDGSYDILS